MATSAYLERMNELNSQRVRNNARELEASGVPINRPKDRNVQSPSGVPTGQSPMPQEQGEDESYKNSHFYNAFDSFKQNDPHFGGVIDELTKLATGLREQVNQGYMPPQIARQRLTQFVGDTMAHFQREEPRLQEEQKQNQMAQLLGAMSGQVDQQKQAELSQQANAPTPPEGISQQQALQQEQAGQQLQGGNQ